MNMDKNIFKQNKPKFNMDKKGQGLSTNAIILIILGVIVLVILILGFTIGWDRFLPFVKSNNVENIKTACSLACSTGNQFDFCSTQREVKDGINDKFTSTCNELSGEQYTSRNYGIEACSGISSCAG